ncbi:hypothetical protein [Hydrogenophaga sp. T2]|uniref:hypothetical protein n=1 Tax=Hydrogenophaga sp. T2 TaxID=3132823 RepID=UPI003CE8ACB1
MHPASKAQFDALLRTPFHDAPTGGAQRYRVTSSGKPRSLLARAVKSAKHGAQRAYNAVAPKGIRTQAKLRESLRECSHRMGDLLGAMLTAKANDADLSRIVAEAQRCDAAAKKLLARSDGRWTDADALVSARLYTHLEAMRSEQLGALRRQLASLSTSDVASKDVVILLKGFARAVDHQIGQHQRHALANVLKGVLVSASATACRSTLAELDHAWAAGAPLQDTHQTIELDWASSVNEVVNVGEPAMAAAMHANLGLIFSVDGELARHPVLGFLGTALKNRTPVGSAPHDAPALNAQAPSAAHANAAADASATYALHPTMRAFMDSTEVVFTRSLEWFHQQHRQPDQMPQGEDACIAEIASQLVEAARHWNELETRRTTDGLPRNDTMEKQLALLQAEAQYLPTENELVRALPAESRPAARSALRNAFTVLGMTLRR